MTIGTSRLEFRILGPLAVRVDGASVSAGGPKQRALLALLLLSANRVVSRDRLVAELFPEQSVNSADHALRNHVSRLRKVLAPAVGDEPRLVARAPGYLLRVEPGELDLERFERLVEAGQEALASGTTAAAAVSFREAEALWQGRPLADLEFEPFAGLDVERLEELHLAAVEARIDAELSLGRHRALVPELEALSGEHPLRERFRAQLMLGLYRSGRQAEGLDVYRKTRKLLDEELGLAPGTELQELERAILVQDPALGLSLGEEAGAEPAERLLRCPFNGLAPFEAADAEFFFGRERLVDELVARLAEVPLLAIVGASGSGKSSLLRAGLLPALAAGALLGSARWRQVNVRPGSRPLVDLTLALGCELSEALARVPVGERLVIAVDQLEEVFAASVAEDERRAFLAALVEAAWDPDRRATILVALRADFLGSVATHIELADLVGATPVLLGPMSAGELRRAIVGPAERVGLEVEPALVDALVNDLAGEAGGLSLLSTTLLDLWEERDDRALTLAAYERSGGVRTAVARHAEAAFASLDEGGRDVARRILMRLAAGGDGGALTRRRTNRSEIDADQDEQVARVLETLVARRLLVADGKTVELVHEALLEQWPRLASWLEEDAQGRRLRHHVAQVAAEWDTSGRDPAELYRGPRLTAALDWAESSGGETGLNRHEQEFLEASRLASVRDSERQRQANRRLWIALATVLMLLALTLVAGLIAVRQRHHARTQAHAADAQRLGADALLRQPLDQSLLLAREAVALDDSRTTRADLLSALLRSPAALMIGHSTGARVLDEALSPDGRTLAARGDDGATILLDTRTLRPVGDPIGGSDQLALMGAIVGPLHALGFSPDGKTLALGSTTGTAAVLAALDARTHDNHWSQLDPNEHVADLFFSPDGTTIATGEPVSGEVRGPPETIVVRSARTGRVLAQSNQLTAARLAGYTGDGGNLLVTLGENKSALLDAHTLAITRSLPLGGAATTSPTGNVAAFGRADGTVTLLDTNTRQRRTLPGRIEGAIQTISFSRDGRRLATGADNGLVAVWDRRLGLVETYVGQTADVRGALFSPDGRTLYTAASDGTVVAWDVAGSRRLGRPFRFAPAGPRVAAFAAISPDATTVATSPRPGRIALWHAGSLTPLPHDLDAPIGQVTDVFFSPDNRQLAAAGSTGTAIWNLRSRTVLRTIDRGVHEGALALAPNGHSIATAPDQTEVVVRDERNGRRTAEFPAHGIDTLRFSPDGTLLAGASLDGSVTLWNIRRRVLVAQLLPGAPAVYTIAFSPDGRLLAVGESTGAVTLYDVARRRIVGGPLAGNDGGATGLAFSPDGETLVVVGGGGAIRLWDVASQRLANVLPGSTQGGSVVFFPDGRQLLAVFGNGTGILWDVNPADWKTAACRIANRKLTRAEWQEFLGQRRYRSDCT